MSAAWADDAATAGRLLWRCRRGMKELDVLLERFARKRFASDASAPAAQTATPSSEARPSADPSDPHTFARFLELPDPLLADYLLRSVVPPEPEFAALARSITGVVP
jgi:antitoxin CptB